MNFSLIIFGLIFLFGLMFSLPSLLQMEEGKKISLGLDLQGGLHLLLGVKSEEAIHNKIKDIASATKYFTEDKDILIESILIEKNSFSFELLDEDEISNLDKMFSELNGVEVIKEDLNYFISLSPTFQEQIQEESINKAVETIRNRLDLFGLSEPSVTKQGKYNIVVELPGIKTQEDERKARNLISKQGVLEMLQVDEDFFDQRLTLSSEKIKSLGDILLPDYNNNSKTYLLKETPILSGKQITNANVAFSKENQPIINFKLNSLGAKIFADFTEKNVGKRLAIILDGKVYSAPNINERIGGGSGQISGNFTIDEAGVVAIALKSGALPAPIMVEEKRSVGPSLGADSIKHSLIALISGFLLVFAFMIYYYKLAGVISNIALISNLFIIIAVMSLFGATLTLPGMAGIVLTVGMAVDANVIINERIKELLKEGKSFNVAIENGYNNAIRAILDANITTLLVAIILYAYGTGPIKGFAITISIGILASMLTSIIGTHGFYESFRPRNKKQYLNWFGLK